MNAQQFIFPLCICTYKLVYFTLFSCFVCLNNKNRYVSKFFSLTYLLTAEKMVSTQQAKCCCYDYDCTFGYQKANHHSDADKKQDQSQEFLHLHSSPVSLVYYIVCIRNRFEHADFGETFLFIFISRLCALSVYLCWTMG